MPPNRPTAGTECPPESSGARCPGGTQKLGEHYRQTVMYCESSVWVERSQPCSNECSARGPNAIDLPDDCGSRRVVDCNGESMSSLLNAAIHRCEIDAFANQIQVEVEDGCPRVVSSDKALSRCAIGALSSTRWECGSGFSCEKASFLSL